MRDVKVFGKINEELCVESVTQTYYEDNVMGVSLHISGKADVVSELMRDVKKLVDKRLAVERLTATG